MSVCCGPGVEKVQMLNTAKLKSSLDVGTDGISQLHGITNMNIHENKTRCISFVS